MTTKLVRLVCRKFELYVVLILIFGQRRLSRADDCT